VEETNLFNIIFFVSTTAVVFLQFILNLWAYHKQRQIEKSLDGEHIPEALKDRSEVTFWQTISSFLFAILGVRALLDIGVPAEVPLTIFGIALAIKTIPSARWLWRYYRGMFDTP
jgi:hypothetical protein